MPATKNTKLSNHIIKRYWAILPKHFVNKHQQLSEDFINTHINTVHWPSLPMQKLSIDFINQHINEFDPILLVTYQQMPESYLCKYLYMNEFIDAVCTYQKLTNAFIKKYANRLNKKLLSTYQDFTWDDLHEMHLLLDFSCLRANKNIGRRNIRIFYDDQWYFIKDINRAGVVFAENIHVLTSPLLIDGLPKIN